MGWTYVAAVLRELLLVTWPHAGEVHGELSSVGGTLPWAGGAWDDELIITPIHSLAPGTTGVGGTEYWGWGEERVNRG